MAMIKETSRVSRTGKEGGHLYYAINTRMVGGLVEKSQKKVEKYLQGSKNTRVIGVTGFLALATDVEKTLKPKQRNQLTL
jgi:hypothetical protein